MSRCRVCDTRLTDEELKNRDVDTGAYLDTCFQCLGELATDLDELMTWTGEGNEQ